MDSEPRVDWESIRGGQGVIFSLYASPDLSGSPPGERTRALEAAGRRRRFSAGQVLFSEGDDGRDVFIVLDGVVKLVTTAASGQQVILDLESAGSLLGELSAIDGQPRSASAEAVTPIDVLVLRIEDFRKFLECQPRAATSSFSGWLPPDCAIFSTAAGVRLERRVDPAVPLPVGHGRSLRRSRGDPSVHLPIAQHDLAKLTGLSREAVVKGLRRLRDLGWVETSGRTFVIRDLQAVRDRAQT
jgi:CRP/FNR family cyclic AMP-dependent transcriptional regulator